MTNEQSLFEGAPCIGERPLSSEEKTLLTHWHAQERRRLTFLRLGCLGSACATVGCFVSGLLFPTVVGGIFGTIGFLGLGLGLIPRARWLSGKLALSEAELREARVARYGEPEDHVDALPISGRVLAVDGVPPSTGWFGTVRRVGLAPEIVRDVPGDRRLSDEELGELRRLILLTRRRWTLGEVLALLWLFPLGALLVLFAASLHQDEPLWAVPFLVSLAGMPSVATILNRLRDFRLRQALGQALREGRLEEIVDDESRRLGLLPPSGIVWTVDGRPSALRTRWAPPV